MKPMRPGSGWKHIGGLVYGNDNGARIHLGTGHCRLPDGVFLYGDNSENAAEASLFIRANDGNRKRGLMAWTMANSRDHSTNVEMGRLINLLTETGIQYPAVNHALPMAPFVAPEVRDV